MSVVERELSFRYPTLTLLYPCRVQLTDNGADVTQHDFTGSSGLLRVVYGRYRGVGSGVTFRCVVVLLTSHRLTWLSVFENKLPRISDLQDEGRESTVQT